MGVIFHIVDIPRFTTHMRQVHLAFWTRCTGFAANSMAQIAVVCDLFMLCVIVIVADLATGFEALPAIEYPVILGIGGHVDYC